MTDIARLGFMVESSQVDVAEHRLDDMAAAADRAEAQVDGLAAAARGVSGPLVRMNGTLAMSRGSMGLTVSEGANMGRQFADIGVSLAAGMSPFLIAVQQGPQLMDVFSMAAQRTGASVLTTIRTTAAGAMAAMGPLLPLILAISAAAAVIWGGLSLATRALNQDFGDLTAGMGLTEEQLEKVQNKGVTMGDVVGGTLDYLRGIIWDRLGPSVTALGDWFGETMDRASSFVMAGLRLIISGFSGAVSGIRASWGKLPAALGDLAYQAANAVLKGIEFMINKAGEGINKLLPLARAAGVVNPQLAAIGRLPDAPTDLNLGVRNPYAGAADDFGQTFMTAAAEGAQSGAEWFDRQVASPTGAIRGRAERRIRAEAGEADADRDTSGQSAAGRAARPERIATRAIDPVRLDTIDNTDLLGRVALARKELELVGLTREERDVQMARYETELDLKARGFAADTEGYAQALAASEELVRLGYEKERAENAHLSALLKSVEALEKMRDIDDEIRRAAAGMAAAFGPAGQALGGIATAYSNMGVTIGEIEAERLSYIKEMKEAGEGLDPEKLAGFASRAASAEIQAWGDMASAAKGFFREGSDGYALMTALEMAYRAAQFAGAIQAMGIDARETASTIANALASGAALAAKGAARMFAELGPFAFPVVGAMIALLVGLGIKASGGGSKGGSVSSGETAGDRPMGGYDLTSRAVGSVIDQVSNVNVVVTADRDGLNAYVVGTAKGVAQPLASGAENRAKAWSMNHVPDLTQSKAAAQQIHTPGRRRR